MKNSVVISMLALLISVVGLLIALLAYFKRRSCVLCDDLENDMMECYDEEECDGDCCCGHDHESEPAPASDEESQAQE